jgi:phosphatidylinositol dimannoside acyltransferase
MGLRVAPVVSVAEHLKPDKLFELFLEHRRLLGIDIIDLASDHVGRQLTQKLEQNRIVALVADRDLSGGGVEVEMFGRTRRMPPGPALLSLSSGAPLISGPTYTTGDGWAEVLTPVTIEPTGRRKDDIIALTRALAAAFEQAIAAAPPDWHLFQPGWEP